MNPEEARHELGLELGFTREELQAAYLRKTKAAHKRGKSDEAQQALNVARDVLNNELDEAGAVVPFLSRELVRISTQQELASRRQSAKEDLSASIDIVKVRAVNRLHSNRDITGILAAMTGGIGFLRQNISEIVQVTISPWISSALLLTSAYLASFTFLANRSAKLVEERSAELNRILTRQRTIERIIRHVFSESDTLGEELFEQRVFDAIEMETGVHGIANRWERSGPLNSYLRFFSFGYPEVRHDVFVDYIEFLLASDYVTRKGTSGKDLIIEKK